MFWPVTFSDSNSAEGKTCRGPGLGHPQEARWGLWTIFQERKGRLCGLCRLVHKQNEIKHPALSWEKGKKQALGDLYLGQDCFVSRIQTSSQATRGMPTALRLGSRRPFPPLRIACFCSPFSPSPFLPSPPSLLFFPKINKLSRLLNS